MGKGVHDKKAQLIYIENRIELLSKVLEAIEPDSADLEEMDRIIRMLEDLQRKCLQFRKDWKAE